MEGHNIKGKIKNIKFIYNTYRKLVLLNESIEWIVIRLWLLIPSKHVRNCIFNMYKDVMVSKTSPIYSGFEWWKGPFRVGEYSNIGFKCHIDCRRGVIIGDYVTLATGVCIWTLHHDYNDIGFCCKGGG